MKIKDYISIDIVYLLKLVKGKKKNWIYKNYNCWKKVLNFSGL